MLGHSRLQDLLCYAKTSNKLGSDELWLSLWARLDKLGGPLIVASVIHIKTKNALIVHTFMRKSTDRK